MNPPKKRVVPFRRQGDQPTRPLAHPDYEMQLVGALLSTPQAMRDAIELDPRHFSDDLLRTAFSTLVDMRNRGRKATAVTLAQNLPAAVLADLGGLDGLAGLQQLGQQVQDATAFLTREIRKLGELREIRDACQDLLRAVADPATDAEHVKADFLQRAEAVVKQGAPLLLTKREVAEATKARLHEYQEPASTGLLPLDRVLGGGLFPQRLAVIAAPYGRGKTILAGSISDNLEAFGVPHAFLSLETPVEDIELRHLAHAAGANASQLTDPEQQDRDRILDRAQSYIDGLTEPNTLYRYMPGATIEDIVHTVMQAVHRHGIKGFILDYFQLIRGREKGQKQENFYQDAADRLAALCRRENLFALVTAQIDEHGQIRDTNALNASATTIVRMQRDLEGVTVIFDVAKCNHGRWIKPPEGATEHAVFDMSGPRFRDVGESDHGSLSQASDPADSAIPH